MAINIYHTIKIYRLILDNYQGYSDVEYYRNKENAYKRLNELWDEGERKEEFNWENKDGKLEYFSFFDPSYNEYSTCISLEECLLEDLFND